MFASDSSRLRFLGERMQLGYVVADLDAALCHWTEVLGIGPFVVIERAIEGRPVFYHGLPTSMEVTLAFAYCGDVQIELIHAANDEPSIYRDFTDIGREGLHHVGYWPVDFAAACQQLEAWGYREASVVLGDDGGRVVVHYNAPAHIGTLVELVPASPQRNAYFERLQRLARGWDGTRPVRRYETRDAFLASGEGMADWRCN